MDKDEIEELARDLHGKLNPKREALESTKKLPILRIKDREVERLNFDKLLWENLGYPDFAESVGNELIKERIYDDCDPGSFTFVIYTTGHPAALREQMKRRSSKVEVYY